MVTVAHPQAAVLLDMDIHTSAPVTRAHDTYHITDIIITEYT